MAHTKALNVLCYILSLQDLSSTSYFKTKNLYLYLFWVSQDVVSVADSSS